MGHFLLPKGWLAHQLMETDIFYTNGRWNSIEYEKPWLTPFFIRDNSHSTHTEKIYEESEKSYRILVMIIFNLHYTYI